MDRRSFFASVSAVLAAPLAALGMGRGGFKPRHLPRGGLVIKRPVPAAGLFLTCSVDVLQDRLEVEVLAWGRGLRSYSVCTGEIGSFKSRSEQWQDLESLLLVDLPCTGGGTMPIWLMGIDAGYRWSEVYDFCLRHPAMQVDGSHGVWKPPSVIPIKGGGSGQKLIESVSMFRRNGRAEKEPLPVGQNMRVVTVGSFAAGRNHRSSGRGTARDDEGGGFAEIKRPHAGSSGTSCLR